MPHFYQLYELVQSGRLHCEWLMCEVVHSAVKCVSGVNGKIKVCLLDV